MSVLGDKQRKFSGDFALLTLYAIALGYKVTHQPEHEDHIEGSLHYLGLAEDINIFKDGVYLDKTEDHEPLGFFWESLGNTWGGRFEDGNHYSIEHNGMR